MIIDVTSEVHVAYTLPASAYVYFMKGTAGQFSLNVKPGTYWLVWYNPYSAVAHVKISKSVQVGGTFP